MFNDEELNELSQIVIWALAEGYCFEKSAVLESVVKKLPIIQSDLHYIREISGLAFD